ncbi:hypothetical protein KPH14_009680 [Odynerus spinipes]|uniref:Uncharacterized protein n=1 Tax=Odynerus spinipes TaxID=1348599 RepID=A0AAD9VQZ8_9HYME|nr:hypothetical protein KPH14_009680 [Odynerus spinipes]
MEKLLSDIAFLNRNGKRRVGDRKKQEIKVKRKKRKKDFEKLHRNAAGASKGSVTRVYRNGAKGKEVRKRNLPSSKFYKTRLQGEVAKLLDRDTSAKKSKDEPGSSPEIVRIDLDDNGKKLVEEDSFSSEEEVQLSKKVSKKQLTTSRKFPCSAMFRYEELCAIFSDNFDDRSMTLSQLPDPVQKIKESLNRLHTNAMWQHFSRPDMNINDYITNLKNQTSPKTLVDETGSVHVPNIQTEYSSDSLTADIVENTHPETSPIIIGETESKSQPNNIYFSVPKEQSRAVRKKKGNGVKNFRLPHELFDESISPSTTLTGDEDEIMKMNCERCAKRNIDDIKCNARFKKDDKLKHYTKHVKDVKTNKTLSDMESERFTFINRASKRNLPRDRAQTQKYIEDRVKDYKSRRTIQDTIDTSDTGICTNLSERVMARKATKSLKHVPAILQRSVCDPTSLSDLTYFTGPKCNDVNLKRPSKKNFDFNFNICSAKSSNESVINIQPVRVNKRLETQHRMTKEKSSTSMHRTINCYAPVEINARKKTNKIDTKRESDGNMQFPPQKSVTFSKGISLNADTSMQPDYNKNHNTTKTLNVDKTATTTGAIHCHICHDNQPLLLNRGQMHQPKITFINPQYNECVQNPQEQTKALESKPVYFQIINQPTKPRVEQIVINQSLMNNPVTTLATCNQTFPNQSMIQQTIVPKSNVQFTFPENNPRIYAFSDLQNLKLLTLNESQNVCVNTLNSAHKPKRVNECAIIQNVDQPMKYLAFEKDLTMQRVPIYFHNNNDETVTQQHVPCQMVTAVEKQINDNVFYYEPSSQVIVIQGSNLHGRDRQLIDPNDKHLV